MLKLSIIPTKTSDSPERSTTQLSSSSPGLNVSCESPLKQRSLKKMKSMLSNESYLSRVIDALESNPKTEDELDLLANSIRSSNFFNEYSAFLEKSTQMQKLCMNLKHQASVAFEEIQEIGEKGRLLYLLIDGTAWMTVNKKLASAAEQQEDEKLVNQIEERLNEASERGTIDPLCILTAEELFQYKYPKSMILKTLNTGDFFGDVELRHRSVRSTGIFAKTPLHLATIDASVFNELFMRFDRRDILRFYPIENTIKIFQSTPIFAKVQEPIIETIIKTAMSRQLTRGQTLYQQGDKSDSIFLIQSGEVELRERVTEKDNDFEIPDENVGGMLGSKFRKKKMQSRVNSVCVLGVGEILGEEIILKLAGNNTNNNGSNNSNNTTGSYRAHTAVCMSLGCQLFEMKITTLLSLLPMIQCDSQPLALRLHWRNALAHSNSLVDQTFSPNSRVNKKPMNSSFQRQLQAFQSSFSNPSKEGQDQSKKLISLENSNAISNLNHSNSSRNQYHHHKNAKSNQSDISISSNNNINNNSGFENLSPVNQKQQQSPVTLSPIRRPKQYYQSQHQISGTLLPIPQGYGSPTSKQKLNTSINSNHNINPPALVSAKSLVNNPTGHYIASEYFNNYGGFSDNIEMIKENDHMSSNIAKSDSLLGLKNRLGLMSQGQIEQGVQQQYLNNQYQQQNSQSQSRFKSSDRQVHLMNLKKPSIEIDNNEQYVQQSSSSIIHSNNNQSTDEQSINKYQTSIVQQQVQQQQYQSISPEKNDKVVIPFTIMTTGKSLKSSSSQPEIRGLQQQDDQIYQDQLTDKLSYRRSMEIISDNKLNHNSSRQETTTTTVIIPSTQFKQQKKKTISLLSGSTSIINPILSKNQSTDRLHSNTSNDSINNLQITSLNKQIGILNSMYNSGIGEIAKDQQVLKGTADLKDQNNISSVQQNNQLKKIEEKNRVEDIREYKESQDIDGYNTISKNGLLGDKKVQNDIGMNVIRKRGKDQQQQQPSNSLKSRWKNMLSSIADTAQQNNMADQILLTKQNSDIRNHSNTENKKDKSNNNYSGSKQSNEVQSIKGQQISPYKDASNTNNKTIKNNISKDNNNNNKTIRNGSNSSCQLYSIFKYNDGFENSNYYADFRRQIKERLQRSHVSSVEEDQQTLTAVPGIVGSSIGQSQSQERRNHMEIQVNQDVLQKKGIYVGKQQQNEKSQEGCLGQQISQQRRLIDGSNGSSYFSKQHINILSSRNPQKTHKFLDTSANIKDKTISLTSRREKDKQDIKGGRALYQQQQGNGGGGVIAINPCVYHLEQIDQPKISSSSSFSDKAYLPISQRNAQKHHHHNNNHYNQQYFQPQAHQKSFSNEALSCYTSGGKFDQGDNNNNNNNNNNRIVDKSNKNSQLAKKLSEMVTQSQNQSIIHEAIIRRIHCKRDLSEEINPNNSNSIRIIHRKQQQQSQLSISKDNNNSSTKKYMNSYRNYEDENRKEKDTAMIGIFEKVTRKGSKDVANNNNGSQLQQQGKMFENI